LNLSDSSDIEDVTPTLVLVKDGTNPSDSTILLEDKEPDDNMDVVVDSDSSRGSTYVPRGVGRKKRKPILTKRKPSSTGRLKDRVWDHFTEDTANIAQKRPNQICKFCNQHVSAEAARLRKHLQKCRRKPAEPVAAIPDPAPAPLPKKTPTLDSFLCNTKPEMKDRIDLALAKFIFSSNIPFKIVENKEFKSFVKLLKPSYTLPTRQYVADTLLDKVYEEIDGITVTELQGQEVVIMQDGWSNMQNQPVIAHSLALKDKIFFTNAEGTGTNTKSAEYCKTLLEEHIEDAEEKYAHSHIQSKSWRKDFK